MLIAFCRDLQDQPAILFWLGGLWLGIKDGILVRNSITLGENFANMAKHTTVQRAWSVALGLNNNNQQGKGHEKSMLFQYRRQWRCRAWAQQLSPLLT
jgi:hypothetical protein